MPFIFTLIHACDSICICVSFIADFKSFVLNTDSTQTCVNRQLFSVDDEKAVNYAAMVLHTCLDEAKVEELSKPQNIKVALRLMELCRTHPDLDWT